MDSVSEADGVIVVDTGSDDNTVQKLKGRGAVVFEEKIEPWRFDTARNIAMDHIPEDVDICVSIDIDELFESGWREKLEKLWDTECTQAKYWYFWDETLRIRFVRDKIHKRHGFKWVNPVHEILEYSGNQKVKTVFINDLILYHKPDSSKSRAQYLPLLEMSSKENPDDDRTRFWLGREYIYKGFYDKGIETLNNHLKLPSAVWNEERSASMRFIARAFRAKNDNNTAKGWLYKAIAECSTIREPWLDLARLGYDTKNWPLLYFAAKKGLDIKTSSNSYLVEPDAWGHLLEDLAAIACYWLGFYEKALEHAKRAYEISPDNQRLKQNLEIIKARFDRGGTY